MSADVKGPFYEQQAVDGSIVAVCAAYIWLSASCTAEAHTLLTQLQGVLDAASINSNPTRAIAGFAKPIWQCLRTRCVDKACMLSIVTDVCMCVCLHGHESSWVTYRKV